MAEEAQVAMVQEAKVAMPITRPERLAILSIAHRQMATVMEAMLLRTAASWWPLVLPQLLALWLGSCLGRMVADVVVRVVWLPTLRYIFCQHKY